MISELFLNSEEERRRINHLMQELLAGLPPESASIDVKDDPSGIIFILKPVNPASAMFGIHYDGCVDVFFGKKGSTLELP